MGGHKDALPDAPGKMACGLGKGDRKERWNMIRTQGMRSALEKARGACLERCLGRVILLQRSIYVKGKDGIPTRRGRRRCLGAIFGGRRAYDFLQGSSRLGIRESGHPV